MLMQDTLEDHVSLGGGGGCRGGGKEQTLQRRAGSNVLQNPFNKQQKQFTARIVVMGDDRILGHLAKAFYFFRWELHPFTEFNIQIWKLNITSLYVFSTLLDGEHIFCISRIFGLSVQEKGSTETFSHYESQPPVLLHPCLQAHESHLPQQRKQTSSCHHTTSLSLWQSPHLWENKPDSFLLLHCLCCQGVTQCSSAAKETPSGNLLGIRFVLWWRQDFLIILFFLSSSVYKLNWLCSSIITGFAALVFLITYY